MSLPEDPVVISILLPTRGRRLALKRSLESLITTADIPGRLEILLGVDDDDHGLLEYIDTEINPIVAQYRVGCSANVFQPIGYENMHQYVNHLASQATGEWLVLWSDDGIMLSDGWDTEIADRTGQFKLLAFQNNHGANPYSIFPIIPRDWYLLNEHISHHAQLSAWLSNIAYMLDIFERIDAKFLHDRADLTGNNNDETFKNRKELGNNPDDPGDFMHSTMQELRVKTCTRMSWFMRKIGQPSIWWEDVLTGKNTDPFAKIKDQLGVNGVKIDEQGPRTKTHKTKIYDSAKLIL